MTLVGIFFCWFICCTLPPSIRSQTTKTLWSDVMDSYPSDWSTTTNAALATTNCPSSSKCWSIGGNGGTAIHTVTTTGFQDIQLQFSVNVNLDNGEQCQVSYRYYNDKGQTSYWYTIGSYTTNTIYTTLALENANDRSKIDIRFTNTGNHHNQDICYLDQVSVTGIVIVAPTPIPSINPTTLSPTTPSPTKQPTAPTAPTEKPTVYDGSWKGYNPSTRNQGITRVHFSPWNSWGSFFAFLGGIAAIGAMTYPVCGLCYRCVKDVSLDMYGIETTGIVERKHIKVSRGKNRTRYTYLINYKYCGPNEEEYRDERAIFNAEEWNGVNIGHHVDVKYMPGFPRCNRKRHCCGYFGLTLVIVLVFLMAMTIFGCAWLMYWSWTTNWLEMLTWSIVLSIIVCGIPCTILFICHDIAKPVSK